MQPEDESSPAEAAVPGGPCGGECPLGGSQSPCPSEIICSPTFQVLLPYFTLLFANLFSSFFLFRKRDTPRRRFILVLHI